MEISKLHNVTHIPGQSRATYIMRLTEELTTGVKRVISAWLGFAYIISPPIVRIIGMGNSTSGQTELSSKSMFGKWNAARENWWTSTSSMYENITSIGDALMSCYSLLESSWSVRSKGVQFLSELKLRHSLSSWKTFSIWPACTRSERIITQPSTGSQ